MLPGLLAATSPAAADFVSGVYGVGTRPNAVASGDFDGDGHADLATADSGSNSISILWGELGGTFVPGTRVTVGQSPFGLVAGHFDGNTAADLAVANLGSDTVTILAGNRSRAISATSSLMLDPGAGPAALALVDVNRDGRPDLAVTNFGLNTTTVFAGRGDGGFDRGATFPVGASPIAITAADLDANGVADLAVANSESNDVSILLAGSGTLSPGAPLRLPPAFVSVPTAVVAGNFVGGPEIDLAVTAQVLEGTADSNVKADKLYIFAGRGGGAFEAPQTYAAGTNPRGAAAADFDGDGRSDLAIATAGRANFDSALVVLLSSTGFESPVGYGAGLGPRAVIAGDLDQDGKTDLATANFGS
ncbi:MAG: VCBS repeat-containing protein, partial [Actinobacteria bacterium]|nr:VCBS repeat-containing protein [Actinomycetota bacterium]